MVPVPDDLPEPRREVPSALPRVERQPCHALASCLLVGGRSTRMGRDKAGLERGGQPLWARQLDLLRTVDPRVCVAAPEKPTWLGGNVPWVRDAPGVEGPLGGIISALQWARCVAATHLFVLAVDMPRVSNSLLRSMIDDLREGKGVVPLGRAGYESLCMVYPVAALTELGSFTERRIWKLQTAIAHCVDLGLLAVRPISADEESQFFNLNTPAELAGWEAG